MSVEMVILMGLQASGKTTFWKGRFAETHVVVSKDALRNNRRPGRRQAALIREALSAGRSVLVDNTNPRAEDRAELIHLARQFGATVVVYHLRSTVADSLVRNAAREGRARVPDVGVYSTAKVFERPTWAEGFDAMYEVTMAADHGFEVKAVEREPP